MGLIMELDTAASKVSEKETPEDHPSSSSDSSSEEEESEEEEEDASEEEEKLGEETSLRPTRRDDAGELFFEYPWPWRGGSWPQVVGLDAREAKRIIEEERPDLYVEVCSEHGFLTEEYCTGRVRIIADAHNRVVGTPSVG